MKRYTPWNGGEMLEDPNGAYYRSEDVERLLWLVEFLAGRAFADNLRADRPQTHPGIYEERTAGL